MSEEHPTITVSLSGGVVYIAYMAIMTAIGVIGELTGSQQMLHVAQTMGVIFLGALGLAGLVVVGLVLACAVCVTCSSVAQLGRALGRRVKSGQESRTLRIRDGRA